MIYNGFQARILDVLTRQALPEALSLTGRPDEPADDTTNAQRDKKSETEKDTIAKVIDAYPPVIRKQAASIIRRGAVQVGSSTIQDNVRAQQPASPSNILLAFRFVGSEHSNATRAHTLTDLTSVRLGSLFALDAAAGSEEESRQPERIDIQSREATRKGHLNVSRCYGHMLRRSSSRSLRADVKRLMMRKRKSETDLKGDAGNRFYFQVYLNHRPLRIGRRDDSTSGVLVGSCASQGVALNVALSRGEANPTRRDEETMTCISLHLWRANRSEILTAKSSSGNRPSPGEWDEEIEIKHTAPPDAILCFELSFGGDGRHASLDLGPLPLLTLPSIMVTSVNGSEEAKLTGEKTLTTGDQPEQSAMALQEGTSFLDDFDALSDVPEEGLSVEISEKTGVQSPKSHTSSASVVDGPKALEGTGARPVDTDSLASSLHRTIEEVRHLQQRHERVRSLRVERESEWLQTLSRDLEKIRSELQERIQIDQRYLEQLDRPPRAHRRLSADR